MDVAEPLIYEYVKETKLIAHQISSFNDFINNGLQQVILRDPEVRLPNNAVIRFGEVFVGTPQHMIDNRQMKTVFPNEAREKQFSYDANIFVNVSVSKDGCDTLVYNRVAIGKIPIMLGSCRCNLTAINKVEQFECPNDPGGYFILNGKEKVLVGQLRPVFNKVYVYPSNDKYEYAAEIRSISPGGNSLLIKAKIDKKCNLFFSVPYIKDHLNPGLVFKAMGISREELDIILFLLPSSFAVEQILSQYSNYSDQNEAIEEVSKSTPDKDLTAVHSILQKEMFCHLGYQTPLKNGLHLAYLLKKLIETKNKTRACDDRDNLANKRLDTANALLLFIFQSLYKQMLKTISTTSSLKKGSLNTPKEPDYVAIIKSASNITQKITSCFTGSNWEVQKASTFTRVGVSQMLSRQNYGATISHLRRIMHPVGKKGKLIKMRQLGSSHFGFICPYETPEGQQVGTVLNLALSAQITVETPHVDVLQTIKTFTSFDCNPVGHKTIVLLNGVIIGTTANSWLFFKEFCSMRDSDVIQETVSITRLKQENEVHVWSDQGRFVRPLFKIVKNKRVFEKIDAEVSAGTCLSNAIKNHSIVFRDPSEIEQSVIASNEEDLGLNICDYMEIHPVLVYGLMAAVIPFSNCSQSPRLAYQSCMGKQAQGVPFLSFRHRWDTTEHVLDSPQKPLTQSKIVNFVGFNEMSHGNVPIVAIMSYSGFNQEDAFILNKASLDRGLFHSTTYKTITEEAKKRGNSDFESICLPKAEYRKREFNYELIGPDGVIRKPEAGASLKINKGDVIIGKTLTKVVKGPDDKRENKTVDISIVAKQNEEGYLDDVLDSVTPEGVRIVKVRIRIPRRPEIGDKFASICAQKGTNGMIFRQEDMPFDKDGVVPDLIMNPHAIPSRMTVNMLIEMAANLVSSSSSGKQFDATAFEHKNIARELQELNDFHPFAKTMYSGLTGKAFPEKVFMAPCYFQKLKHMVSDKFHARRCGPLDTLTHQPVAGRAKDGGLKCGEMERDSLIVHGCSEFLNETMFLKSDKYHVAVCKTCGLIPPKLTTCSNCRDDNVEVKNMPYAAKLLFHLSMGMGIKVKIE